MKKIVHAQMRRLCLFWAVGLIIAGIIASFYTGETADLLEDLAYIVTTPVKAPADFFSYGSLGATLVNTGLCGLAVVLVAGYVGAEFTSAMVAAFFLIIGHTTHGKSILNIWPCAIGTALFFWLKYHDLKDHLYTCIMASCFGPLISEILFRYTLDSFDVTSPVVTAEAVLVVIVVSLVIGYLFPKFLSLSLKLHKGYTLFNAGSGGGMLAVLLYFILYKVIFHEVPEALIRDNPLYESYNRSYILFVNAMVITLCLLTILRGMKLNGWSFKGYSELFFNKTGNLLEKYGEALCMVNIGVFGLYMLSIYDFFILTDASGAGVGFTGMTTGAMFSSLTFVCTVETPACTWPMVLGYILLALIRTVTGGVWHPAVQSNLSTISFAAGMCPLVLRHGNAAGIAAGMLCSFFAPYMAVFHGGFMIYNGGFATFAVAVIFVIFFEIRGRMGGRTGADTKKS